MKEPKFWKRHKAKALLLLPFTIIYFALYILNNLFSLRSKSKLPIICIGNANVGGVGKTPIAIEIGKLLQKRGVKFAYLSRGYRRNTKGLIKISDKHTAEEVGDEPMLLKAVSDTFICENRLVGAKAIESDSEDYGAIIMDDGLQNNSLKKTKSILIVGGRYGFGNRFLLPAGPMREPLRISLMKTDIVIIMGEDKTKAEEQIREINKEIPIIHGYIKAKKPAILSNKNVYAFSGIAHPKRFFNTLEDLGYDIEELAIFDDHHNYSHREVENIIAMAKSKNLKIITTEKDWIKLSDEHKKIISPLKIEIEFDEPKHLKKLVDEALLK
jgi:tetraacyldisaccharide 4'-kinase